MENVSIRTVSSVLGAVKCPVVLIVDDPYDKKYYNLRRACKLVKFFRVVLTSVHTMLRKVCIAEKIPYEEQALQQLSKMSGGDVRGVLIDLEILGDGVTQNTVMSLGFRSSEESIFDTLKVIFKSTSLESISIALANSGAGEDEVLSWVAENIAHEYEMPQEVADAYGHMALAGVFASRITRRQSWSLQKYALLGIRGAALSKNAAYRKFFVYRPPVYVRSSVEPVLAKLAGVFGSRRKALHYMPLFRQLAGSPEIAQAFGFDEGDLKVLQKH